MCQGIKQSKLLGTKILVYANMNPEKKRKLMVFRKYEKPRCMQSGLRK